jgi:hypothetical protein
MYGTTKILSLIVHLVGLIGHRPIESSGPLQLGHYPNPTTMKFLKTNFRNRLNALQAATDGVPAPAASRRPGDATGQALGYFYFGDEPGPVKSGNLCAASHSAVALCI